MPSAEDGAADQGDVGLLAFGGADRLLGVAGLGAYVIDLTRETILVSAELARLLKAGVEAFELFVDESELERRIDMVHTA